MTNIRATCPRCGEVDLTAEDIDLWIAKNEDDSVYTFDCPSCVERVQKPADARIVRLLISGGVRAMTLEESPAPEAPAFTYDDLLDFHAILTSDAAIAAFIEGAHRT